jgi:predicted kinase
MSPITDVLPLATDSEIDLVVTSGNHHASQVTFVKEFIPCNTMKIKDLAGVREVFTVRD